MFERKKIDAVYVERKKITKYVNFLSTVLHLSNTKYSEIRLNVTVICDSTMNAPILTRYSRKIMGKKKNSFIRLGPIKYRTFMVESIRNVGIATP